MDYNKWRTLWHKLKCILMHGGNGWWGKDEKGEYFVCAYCLQRWRM